MTYSYNAEVDTAEHDTKPYSDAVIDFLTKQDGVITPFRFRTKSDVALLSVGRHIYTPPTNKNPWIVLGMWDESRSSPTPIGISERQLLSQQRLADGPHGMLTKYDGEDEAIVLPPALASIKQIAHPMAGFIIQPHYQKKGYGDLLWALTLATLNRLGINTVKIMADTTNMDGKPSFYTHLTPEFTKNEHGSLMIPTTLTPQQQEVFSHVLPP